MIRIHPPYDGGYAISRYEVQARYSLGGVQTHVAHVLPPQDTYALPPSVYVQGVEYAIRVRARNELGDGAARSLQPPAAAAGHEGGGGRGARMSSSLDALAIEGLTMGPMRPASARTAAANVRAAATGLSMLGDVASRGDDGAPGMQLQPPSPTMPVRHRSHTSLMH